MPRGPAPKDPKTRQRTNKSATYAALAVDEPNWDNVPEMGTLKDDEWHPMTIAWWQDVWVSPMASQYLDADKHTLYRLLLMVQEFWRFPTVELSKEIDRAQQAFGLTPLDRRRLEWIVDNAPKPKKLDASTPDNVVAIDPRGALIG